MKTITLSLIAGALLATSSVAMAQGQEGRRGPAAEVTREAAVARAEARFDRLDADRDGRVTANEMRQVRQARRGERQVRQFDRLDANRDGMLSRAEFGQRQALRAERLEGRAERRGDRRAQRGLARAERRAARLFGHDGAITREEFRARALQRFERLDANRDGTVTLAERQAMRQHLRSERQGRRQAPQQN